MLGNKADKEQEEITQQIIGLDLNLDQATITYLSYQRSIEETEDALKQLKHVRTLPVGNRPEELQDVNILNENINLAQYMLEKYRYLLGEVKLITEELAPPEKGESTIITKPNWNKG